MADVPARGLRFHVQRIASSAPAPRPTVVFVHGLVMDNLSSWYFAAGTAMAKVADVICYDLRGHGRSQRPPRGYGVAEHVADLKALLDNLDIDGPVHLVGNSFGGLVALAFAAMHRTRAAGVVLVDAHLGQDGFADGMVSTLRLTGPARDARIAESFSSWLGRHQERKRTRLADAARALIEGTTLVDDLGRTPRLDLAKIRCPVLALYGEHSDLRDGAERVLDDVPGARIEIFEECSHSILWEATEHVRQRLIDFVVTDAAPGGLITREFELTDALEDAWP
jgi:pimeloyl-ACP methyl ester carboxylesterase